MCIGMITYVHVLFNLFTHNPVLSAIHRNEITWIEKKCTARMWGKLHVKISSRNKYSVVDIGKINIL